jgi:hypothetical protein
LAAEGERLDVKEFRRVTVTGTLRVIDHPARRIEKRLLSRRGARSGFRRGRRQVHSKPDSHFSVCLILLVFVLVIEFVVLVIEFIIVLVVEFNVVEFIVVVLVVEFIEFIILILVFIVELFLVSAGEW